ncbi:MAG TPA: thermonuclease family protein [Azonexus sp.]|nr:thermonuclease family protein [Azonexus sp.]
MIAIRAVVVLLTLLSGTAHAEVVQGRVVGITDGDTLTLLDATNQQHKIRLAGIDAPEKEQVFGQKAKESLSALAFEQQATAHCKKRDRYRQEICVVTVGGKDVGLEQVRTGMAWWHRQLITGQTIQERAEYDQAESSAKSDRRGLWSGLDLTPPWEWRHRTPEE